MPEETLRRSSNTIPPTAHFRRFRIELRGQLPLEWVTVFEPISISSSERFTVIEVLADQAGLRGLMNRLWDLNLDIFSVVAIELPSFRNGGD